MSLFAKDSSNIKNFMNALIFGCCRENRSISNFGPSVYFPTSPVQNLTAVPRKRAVCHNMGILTGVLEGNASPPTRVNRVWMIAFRLARTRSPDHIKTSASENRVVCSISWILSVARKALGFPEFLVGWPFEFYFAKTAVNILTRFGAIGHGVESSLVANIIEPASWWPITSRSNKELVIDWPINRCSCSTTFFFGFNVRAHISTFSRC